MDTYQNKYRISSARLQGFDYGQMGAYFITICTQDRVHYFGDIVVTPGTGVSTMNLNAIGKIVESEWIKTPDVRPDMNLELGQFVVMPNHFHAIIIIGKNEYNTVGRRDAMHRASTIKKTTTQNNKFGPQSKNLASIIRGFKSSVTIRARKINADFQWQPRFHDHIIRNKRSFENIQKYIATNPMNWKKDQLYV